MSQPPVPAFSKYTRTNPPNLQDGILDFCNSFWGFEDAGVDVLISRMGSAAQTMEDMNAFWKERASIEEDYANRLAKLAEMTLGRDEIGHLRKSLDAIRVDTELQAEFHLLLARRLRSEFEVPTTMFHARQLHHKLSWQASVEKLFKTKQTRELYVRQTRKIYEQECVRIDVMEAQEGRVLERMDFEFERAKITSVINGPDYLRFSMALQETVIEWEQEWKSFCDSCQDMEEDRMKFMKDTFLNYGNAVSTVCAVADECRQSMRIAFEEMEAEKELEIFVWEYGTGNQIPDPPHFVTKSAPNGTTPSSAQPTSHIAKFIRSTSREIPLLPSSNYSLLLEEEPGANATGFGDEKATAFRENEPYTSESVVDTPPQPIATSSKARPVSQNGIRPLPNPPATDSMVPTFTQPVGAEVAQASVTDHQPMLPGEHIPLTLRNTSRRHLPSLSQVFVDSGGEAPIPTATTRQRRQPVEVAGYSGWENDLQRSTISASPESGSNEPLQQQRMWAVQQRQMLVAQQQLQRMYHDNNPVWRSYSQSSPQVIDDFLDSDLSEESGGYYYSATDEPEGYKPEDHETEDHPDLSEESGGYYYSATDEPEGHEPEDHATEHIPDMSAMSSQMSGRLKLFLKQRRQRNSSNLNVNPLNFVIKKEMKSRRITHCPHSTSESSMKIDTDSFISLSSE